MLGSCVKQRVIATIITPDGKRFVGENDCLNAQKICPRGNLPTGQGYELCKSICQQTNHAEINAVILAGKYSFGSKLYLEGHTYACEPCKSFCLENGIDEIVIGSPP